jgi:hypothetical protein
MIGSDCIRTEAPACCFDAFSSREPSSTSLENAREHDSTELNRAHRPSFVEHGLFGKPVAGFPDHAQRARLMK